MEDKVALITGANRGIGKEIARGLAHAGATVVLGCRDVAAGDKARQEIVETTGNARIELHPLDLGSGASIVAFAAAVRSAHPALHVLVHNAGVLARTRTITADGFERTFGTNHLGPFLLTRELEAPIKAGGARIVVLSSVMHGFGRIHLDDPNLEKRRYSESTAYNQSKLANVLFARALADRWRAHGVTANSVHPGTVRSDLLREMPSFLRAMLNPFLLTAEQGAKAPLQLALEPRFAGVSGKYFDKLAESRASGEGNDVELPASLWSLSEKLWAAKGFGGAA